MFWVFVVGLLALVASLAWHQEIAKEISKEIVAVFTAEQRQKDDINLKQQLTDAFLELTEANLKLKEKDTTIDTIRTEVVRSKQQLMDANLKLAEANMTSQRLTTLVQYIKDAAADSVKLEKLMAEKSIYKKRKSLKASEERSKALEESNTSLNARIEYLDTLIATLSTEKSELLGNMASKDSALDASRDIRDTLAKSNAELTTKVASLTTDNASLRNRIVSLDGDGWDLHHQVEYKIRELRDMTMQLEQRAKNNADMREYITELQETIDGKDELFKAYKQNMTATIHALEGQIQDLATKSEAQEKGIRTQKEHVKELTTKCHAHWGRICDLRYDTLSTPNVQASTIANTTLAHRAVHTDFYNQFFQATKERDQAKETCAKITAKMNDDISVALGKLEKALGDIEIVRNKNKALKEENEDLAVEVQQLVEHLESRVPNERTGYGYVAPRAREGEFAITNQYASAEDLCSEFAEEIRYLGYMCREGYQSEWDENSEDDEDEVTSERDPWDENGAYDAEDEGTDPWEAYDEPTTVIGNWDDERDGGGVGIKEKEVDPWEEYEDSATVIGDWDNEKDGWYGDEVKAEPWMKYNEPTTIISNWAHKDENGGDGSWEDDDIVFLSDTEGFEDLEVIEGHEIDEVEYQALRERQKAVL